MRPLRVLTTDESLDDMLPSPADELLSSFTLSPTEPAPLGKRQASRSLSDTLKDSPTAQQAIAHLTAKQAHRQTIEEAPEKEAAVTRDPVGASLSAHMARSMSLSPCDPPVGGSAAKAFDAAGAGPSPLGASLPGVSLPLLFAAAPSFAAALPAALAAARAVSATVLPPTWGDAPAALPPAPTPLLRGPGGLFHAAAPPPPPPSHPHGTRRSTVALASAPALAHPPALAPGPPSPPSERVGFVYDARMAELHTPPPGLKHFEQPGRVRAVFARFHREGLIDACVPVVSRQATSGELLAVHTQEHVSAVDRTAKGGGGPELDPDTYAGKGTAAAARLAAGCCAEAAVLVATRQLGAAFCLVRPPGHHAGCCSMSGFCFFNNIAVAARAAQAAVPGLRVAIFDFDVHHGNGTQEVFYTDPSVLYVSLHRRSLGFYPGTGGADETGDDSGAGFSVNVPFAEGGLTGADYSAAMRFIVLPIIGCFEPDLLLISAGFDAAAGDPLGGMALSPAAFASMTSDLMALCPRAVACLEGGYNEDAVATCADATLRAMQAAVAPRCDSDDGPSSCAGAGGARRGGRAKAGTPAALRSARDAQRPFWPAPLGETDAAFDAWIVDESRPRPGVHRRPTAPAAAAAAAAAAASASVAVAASSSAAAVLSSTVVGGSAAAATAVAAAAAVAPRKGALQPASPELTDNGNAHASDSGSPSHSS